MTDIFVSACDEDMKIAGEHIILQQQDKDDVEPIALELQKNKENGNIDKAKILANSFAELAADSLAFNKLIDISLTEPLQIQQAKIMLAYCVDSLWERLMPNDVTAQSAASEFLAKLQELDEDFYNNISQTGAFSLYLLSNKVYPDPEKIGKIFAKLCLKAQEPQVVLLGRTLYGIFNDYIANKIKECDFAI